MHRSIQNEKTRVESKNNSLSIVLVDVLYDGSFIRVRSSMSSTATPRHGVSSYDDSMKDGWMDCDG